MACPASCGDIVLVGNPTADCNVSRRETTPARLAFFGCDVTLPDPIQGNIAALFDDGTIVVSRPLANVTFNDPDTQDIIMDDCSPSLSLVTGRTLTFQDRYAISVTEGSPAVANTFWDYDFWLDKQDQQFNIRAMIIYCNGDVRIPVDRDGNPLILTVYPFINYERPANQGGVFVEFKNVTIRFNGDPLGLNIKTAFNLTDEGIVI